MNKSVKEYFEDKNIGWMLLSLAISICLWFVVINTQNPEESRTYSTRLTVKGIESVNDEGLTVTNLDEITSLSISVKVRGPRLSLDRLRGEDITAAVDLSKLDFAALPGDAACAVEVSLPAGIDDLRVENMSGRTVNAVVERMISETRKVQIDFTGSAENGYTIVTEEIYPSVVTVSGASSAIARVHSVKAEADITGQSEDRGITLRAYACDSEGNRLDDVTLSTYEIRAELKAHVSMRVPVEVSVSDPMDGYSVETVSCTPSSLLITGKPEVLDTIEKITLPEIDISSRTSNVQSVYYVENLLPDGITTADGVEKITVDVKIVGESERELEIDRSMVELEGEEAELEYRIGFENYSVLVKGAESVISSISTDSVKVSVDVSGLAAGTHLVVPHVSLPNGVSLGQTPESITVTVTEE